MKLKKVGENIYLIKFKTQYKLCKTFLRFQEYYESPKYKGRPFTLGEYREWYIKEYGSFSYYKDWSGFNLPITVLDNFKKGLFDPLLKEEKDLLKLVGNKKGYIIGLHENDKAFKETLEHEMVHGLYAMNIDYRYHIDNLIKQNLSNFSTLFKYLLAKGYHESVLYDEAQAYMIASEDYLKTNKVKYPVPLVHMFKCIYNNHKEL